FAGSSQRRHPRCPPTTLRQRAESMRERIPQVRVTTEAARLARHHSAQTPRPVLGPQQNPQILMPCTGQLLEPVQLQAEVEPVGQERGPGLSELVALRGVARTLGRV